MTGHDHTRATSEFASAARRHGAHVGAGLALAAGAVAISSLIALAAGEHVKPHSRHEAASALQPPKPIFALAWPPLFLALTLSGLRIWNAPASPARTRALTLWSLIQGFNITWMAVGPKRIGAQVTAAVAALGAGAAYLWQARRVDAPGSGLAGPYIGWMGFANAIAQRGTARTLH